MALTEFTEEQIIQLRVVKELLNTATTKLANIDGELYDLGSFPESPVGHTAWDIENTINYIQSWIHDGGVEI